MHSIDKCFECPLGKKKKDELLLEADSMIDAASDFVYWQINKCNHEFCDKIKNKEVKESMENETKVDISGTPVTSEKPAEFSEWLVNLYGPITSPNFTEPRFGGYVLSDEGDGYVYIKQVIYNNPATIVLWSDGTKTTSKCDYRDSYNPEMGLILAVMKRLVDGNYVAKLLHDWAPEEGQKRVTLTDVRRKNR